jgi:hypothetical protein
MITGKFYIGMHSTYNLEDNYMGSGTRIGRSIRKYGIENHNKIILEFLPDRNSLVNRESEIVNEELLKDDFCLNLRIGGEFSGGFINSEHMKKCGKAGNIAFSKKIRESPEMQKRFADNGSLQFKKIHESGNHNYATFVGRSHTEETKEKMRLKAQQRIGEKNSSFGTCWITNGSENKKIKKTDDLPEGWSYGRKI